MMYNEKKLFFLCVPSFNSAGCDYYLSFYVGEFLRGIYENKKGLKRLAQTCSSPNFCLLSSFQEEEWNLKKKNLRLLYPSTYQICFIPFFRRLYIFISANISLKEIRPIVIIYSL